MEDKYSNNELHQMLADLKEMVKEGFKGVHARQDKTNGNVESNTKFKYETKAQLRVWKWITGFIGVEGFILIVLFVMEYFKGGQ